MVDGILALVSCGFDERVVLYEWPHDKFQMFVRAADRRRLKDRVDFSIDIAQTISGVFSEGGNGKGKTPLEEHIETLRIALEKLNVC